MNEWLDDELVELRKETEDKQDQERRFDLIHQHSRRLFDALKTRTKDAVQKINAHPELRKRVGGLTSQDAYADKIRIDKETFPAIYLEVTSGPNSIDIRRLVVTNGPNAQERELRESLQVDLDDNGDPFFRNKAGESLRLDDAVGYIFRPFFHPEILEEDKPSSRWKVSSLRI